MARRPAGTPGFALLGILGNPVRASLSPAMHDAALRHLGIDGRYLPFEIPPGALRDCLAALPALGFLGVNVTIPYKEAVLRHLDRVDPAAAAIGAVNTVVVRGGRLEGFNTDGQGFLRALREGGGGSTRGRRVLVVGAGGAARAIAHACLAQGCRTLAVANRTPARSRALCRALRRHFPDAVIEPSGSGTARFRELAAASAVLVNTTPLGGRPGDPLPVPRELLRPGQTVADIVYRPARTPLVAAAEAAGARAVGGLGMLLHQGALALRIWTGRAAPVEVMRRALLAAARSA
jgi:shikimate dehydrogenase